MKRKFICEYNNLFIVYEMADGSFSVFVKIQKNGFNRKFLYKAGFPTLTAAEIFITNEIDALNDQFFPEL